MLKLEKLGEAAGLALRKTLKGKPSLEVRSRIGRLLKRLEAAARSDDRVRFVRALQALEQSGTAAARRLLMRWPAERRRRGKPERRRRRWSGWAGVR